MKTAGIEEHGYQHWPRTGRPVRPYIIDPVMITDEPNADIDEQRRYLLDPIHPHLLALNPGDPETFSVFATNIGLQEFFDWIGPKGFPIDHPLIEIMERYDSGHRHFSPDTFTDAWSDPGVAKAVADEQQRLRLAFLAAEVGGVREAARVILNLGFERGAFEIDLDFDIDVGVVYEQPRHVWSRAWFELIEGLRGKRLPKTCEHCGEPFIPRRRNAAYCTVKCRQRAYERRRSTTDARRAYQRQYKRKERAKERDERDTDTKGDDHGID